MSADTLSPESEMNVPTGTLRVSSDAPRGADDRVTLGLEADHVRRLRSEQAAELLGDDREHARLVGLARHRGRHPPERGLLGGQRAQRLLVAPPVRYVAQEAGENGWAWELRTGDGGSRRNSLPSARIAGSSTGWPTIRPVPVAT